MGKCHREWQTWGKKLGTPWPQSTRQTREKLRNPHSLEAVAAPSCGRNLTQQLPGAALKDRDVISLAQAVGTSTRQAPGPAHPTKQTKACTPGGDTAAPEQHGWASAQRPQAEPGPQGRSERAATGSRAAASGQVSSHSTAGPRRRSASHLSCRGRCFTEPRAGGGRRSTPVFTNGILI